MAPSPVEELALLDLERSNRGASKQRRDQINGEIITMRDLLPLPESARQRLSQLQIMSLSCVYIRKCNIFHKLVQPSRCPVDVPYDFSQALTGFILVTTRDGKLVYISENVTEYLGHSMVDMKTQGDSLFDIVDKRDHGTVQAQLLHGSAGSAGSAADGHDDTTSFFCRMNMSKTLRRQGGFGDVKVMHVKGRFVSLPRQTGGGTNGSEQQVFIAICSPLLTPDVKESLIQNNTTIFKSVHRLDMSFIEITESGEFHFGVTSEEICGRSWYSMLHPEDLGEAKAKHVQLVKSRHEMGCMMTVRMLTATGDVIWINTVMHVRQAAQGNNDDPVIICINQVVSDQEAKQFKIQGQLFALYAARAPDIFFSHHFPPIPPTMDPEMIAHTHAPVFVQPPQFYDEQQHFSNVGQPYPSASQQHQLPHGQHQFAPDTAPDQFPPRPPGHTSTIKALKRKLQENFISSCRPPKLQRLVPGPSGPSGDDFMDNVGGAATQVLMNVNVFRNTADNMFGDGGDVQFFPSGPVSGMLHTVRQTPKLLDHKHMLLNPAALVPTPDVVQKLAATCTLEQVVPEVKVPECYLTPDPSPATSPKPAFTDSIVTHDNQQIRHLTNFVTDRLNELQRIQTSSEVPTKNVVKDTKKKVLPIIDATFVDSFFDDLLSPPPETNTDTAYTEDTRLQIKIEPISPPTITEMCVSPCAKYTEISPLPQIQPTPIYRPLPMKLLEEAAPLMPIDDCTDLQELLDLVDIVASDKRLSGNCCSSYDLQMSPIATPPLEDICSPLSSQVSSCGSPRVPDHHKSSDSFMSSCSPGSAGSSSPGHESRDDILDPDSWLLEPIGMTLDAVTFPQLGLADTTPANVDREDESMYCLKQLLQQQHPWAPCGVSSHQDTQ